MKIVAYFHSPFHSKFGIPKQSGLVDSLPGKIVFEQEYRHPEALRGIEEFDYLWLIWAFSANPHPSDSLVVRPPRLGGNKRVGVFASRSPFRPNGMGLSSVRLKEVEWNTPQGPVLHVLGADLMDGSPIYDIKPYVEYADAHVGVRSGFVDSNEWKELEVDFPDHLLIQVPQHLRQSLCQALALDPRPAYQNDPQRVYGMPFAGRDIKFRVSDGVLHVVTIQ